MTKKSSSGSGKKDPCTRTDADPVLLHNIKARLIHEDEELKKLAKIFYLAGNEVRLKILYLLFGEEELSVCDITRILEMKIPAISQHLRKLKDLGVVRTRRQGRTIYYSPAPGYLHYLEVFFSRLLRYRP